uniref:Putative nuclease HARBI1 n=1 Tax=Sander lucioperca TaxID=283035 RepID=A0A8C9Z1S6_SANLU
MPPGEMAAVIRARRRHRQRRRAERIFATRITLFQLSEHKIIKRYRLSSHAILQLLEEIKDDIESPTQCSHSIPAVVKLLATLQILASGSFQAVIASAVGISQSPLSRIIAQVFKGEFRYIRFPYTAREQGEIKMQFAAMSGFPNVITAIDCTHIAVRAPYENKFVYVNRKNVHSINVQVICDSKLTLTNIVARWPGSTHDSFILTNSSVGNKLQAGAGRDGWLLGDSGYPLRRWLLTPFLYPQSAEEMRYNEVHSRARSVVERAIITSGGRLLYHPAKVCAIIRACGVLHNMALRTGIPLPPDLPPPQHCDPDLQPPARQEASQQGARIRGDVIEHFFPAHEVHR